MLNLIDVKNEDFNFGFSFSIESIDYYGQFLWQERERMFLLNLGRAIDDLFKTGVPVITGVKLNSGVEHLLPGTLFLRSSDPRIEKPNFIELGEVVKLFHYIT